jgi:hypothetical protein
MKEGKRVVSLEKRKGRGASTLHNPMDEQNVSFFCKLS